METKILLGGGGSAADERLVLQRFASWIDGDGPVLYLPIAMPDAGQGQWEWISGALGPLGIGRIEMWTALQGHEAAELVEFGGIFIGGGNTYHLLRQLRAARFMGALREFAAGGGVLYGGSAGAIVIGRDIETCAHMDENSAGIKDTAGLDLVHGHAVWCHYTAADDPLLRDFVVRRQMPVIALAEAGGLWVRGPGEMIPLGLPPVLFEQETCNCDT